MEYPTVSVDEPLDPSEDGGLDVRAAGLWVGPIPSDVPGSLCTLRGLDADGNVVYEDVPIWERAPPKESQRSGGLYGTGIPGDVNAESATIECEPPDGRGWYAETTPSIEVVGDNLVVVTATLAWRGEPLRNAFFTCTANVMDAKGGELGSSHPVSPGISPESKNQSVRETFDFRVEVADPDAAKRASVQCRIS